MTPEERAEKIHKVFCGCRYKVSCGMPEMIAAEIREAVEEATGHKFVDTAPTLIQGVALKTRADAYEDAAKIAENYFGKGINAFADKIAENIRARAKEIQ